MKYSWTKVFTVPHGHRFFRDEISGNYAAADFSGATPDRTEDGVLWFDTSKKVTVNVFAPYGHVTVPVSKGVVSDWLIAGNAEEFLPFLRNCGFEIEIEEPGLVQLVASFVKGT